MFRSSIFYRQLLDKSCYVSGSGDEKSITISSTDQFTDQDIYNQIFSQNIRKAVLTVPKLDNVKSAIWFYMIETVEISVSGQLVVPDNCFNGAKNIKKVKLASNFQTIGENAFTNTGLTNINLENVKSIRNGAFSNCFYLEQVDITNVDELGGNVFGHSGLKSIKFSDSLEFIANQMCDSCYFLQKAVFGPNVQFIGASAFHDCISLTEIEMDYDMLQGIDSEAFYRTSLTYFKFGSNLSKFASSVFYQTMLKTVEFSPRAEGNSITLTETFKLCQNIKEFTFIDGVFPGDRVFCSCSSLESVRLNDQITTIPNTAFRDCAKLKQINLDNVQSIGNSAFFHCYNLTVVNLTSCLSFGTSCFRNCFNLEPFGLENHYEQVTFSEDCFYGCSKLAMSKIPSNYVLALEIFGRCDAISSLEIFLTDGQDYTRAFVGCFGLKSVVIDQNSKLNNIPEGMFMGCKNLESVTLAPSITSIMTYAFFGCKISSIDLKNVVDLDFCCFMRTKLESISLYHDFTPNRQFEKCSNLKKIKLSNSISKFSTEAFKYCYNLESFELESGSNYTFNDKLLIYKPDNNLIACLTDNKRKSLTIPFDIVEIKSYAFMLNTFTEEIIVDHLITFDSAAFANFISLRTFTYKLNTWGSIPGAMFQNCFNLRAITTESRPTEVSGYAFQNCYNLKSIDFCANCRNYGAYAFSNCTNLENVNLTAAEEIGTYAFADCVSITKLSFGDHYFSIQRQAFSNISITELNLSSPYSSVQRNAFQYCSKLRKLYLNIPDVDYSLNWVFLNCSIEYIYLGKNVKTFTHRMFVAFQTDNCTIEVSPENKFYRANGRTVIDIGNNRITSAAVLQSDKEYQIPTDAHLFEAGFVQPNQFYSNGYPVSHEPTVLKIPENVLDILNYIDLPRVYSVCYGGDEFFSGSTGRDDVRIFTKEDYPYPTLFEREVEFTECTGWIPPFINDPTISNSIGGNVFGLTKNEMLLIIIVVLVGSCFLAFVIYFVVKYKKACKRNPNDSKSQIKQPKSDEEFVMA